MLKMHVAIMSSFGIDPFDQLVEFLFAEFAIFVAVHLLQ
jgi:hypothetical protein